MLSKTASVLETVAELLVDSRSKDGLRTQAALLVSNMVGFSARSHQAVADAGLLQPLVLAVMGQARNVPTSVLHLSFAKSSILVLVT